MSGKPQQLKSKVKFNSNMMKEVWEDNFLEEIQKLSKCLESYKYIAMVFYYI
jgi:hypothetical protein